MPIEIDITQLQKWAQIVGAVFGGLLVGVRGIWSFRSKGESKEGQQEQYSHEMNTPAVSPRPMGPIHIRKPEPQREDEEDDMPGSRADRIEEDIESLRDEQKNLREDQKRMHRENVTRHEDMQIAISGWRHAQDTITRNQNLISSQVEDTKEEVKRELAETRKELANTREQFRRVSEMFEKLCQKLEAR